MLQNTFNQPDRCKCETKMHSMHYYLQLILERLG